MNTVILATLTILVCLEVPSIAYMGISRSDISDVIENKGDELFAREKRGFLFGKPKTTKAPKKGGSGKADLAKAAIDAASDLFGGNHATGGPTANKILYLVSTTILCLFSVAQHLSDFSI